MDALDALILGIIQGLTEFLPVSSSGHLELGKVILGDNSIPKNSLMFTVVLHFATALSTVVVFREDVSKIFKGLFKFQRNEETEFSLKILISMIPAGLVGFFFEEELESLFGGNLLLVGSMLLVTALLLVLADRAKKTDQKVTYLHALIIGVAQAFALLPGVSRSGATIATSVLLGDDRGAAARFSFLMVVPLIIGKMLKDILSGEFTQDTPAIMALLVGFAAAFLTGLLACTWMIKLVKQSKLTYFAVYCAIVGIIAIVFTYLR